MFGLNFLNQIFLIGTAAAALPILIHLFSRRRAREIEFSSLEYLQEISRKKVRRLRMRQWILLALRVLIVALFAMAMSRPVLPGGEGGGGRGSTTMAILLDNSYSMAAADPRLLGGMPAHLQPVGDAGRESTVREAGTLYQAARERALQILDISREGDRAILATSGTPVSLPFQTPVADAALLGREIERAPLVATGADFPSAVEQLLEAIRTARTVNRELFLISDFQRADMDAWMRMIESGSARRGQDGDSVWVSGGLDLPEDLAVYLVPIRGEPQENVAMERMRYQPLGGVRGGGELVVTLINHGESPVTDRAIRATVAGGDRVPLADGLFSLAPRGRSDVALDLDFLPDDGAIEVRLGADPLEWDNRGYLVVGAPGARRVLLVTHDASTDAAARPPASQGAGGAVPGRAAGADGGGGRFLSAALDPDGTGEFFQVLEADPEILARPESWNQVDVVILSNIGRISEQSVENLRRFRQSGGGIFIALGDHVDPRYYNTAILSRLGTIELLNISAEHEAGVFRSLRPGALSHPIFSGFPIAPGEDLGSARFERLVHCRGGSDAIVVAEFGRGVPAILEEDGLILFTSSLDGIWNDFVTSASFPPLLHKMILHLAGRGGGRERAGLVGGRLETQLALDSFRGPVVCVDPAGTQLPVEEIPVERMVRLRSAPTVLPGIHRFVDSGDRVVASFAVNLDPAEGDLTPVERSVLRRIFGERARFLEPGRPVTRDLLAGAHGREIWRWLLVMVLGLLAVESVIGRGRLLG